MSSRSSDSLRCQFGYSWSVPGTLTGSVHAEQVLDLHGRQRRAGAREVDVQGVRELGREGIVGRRQARRLETLLVQRLEQRLAILAARFADDPLELGGGIQVAGFA